MPPQHDNPMLILTTIQLNAAGDITLPCAPDSGGRDHIIIVGSVEQAGVEVKQVGHPGGNGCVRAAIGERPQDIVTGGPGG